MADAPIKLESQRYRIVLGDEDLPDTWSVIEVQSLGRDQVIAESILRSATKTNAGEHAIRFMYTVAFVAAKRRGLIEATATWGDFEGSFLEVTVVDTDVARPTEPGPGPG